MKIEDKIVGLMLLYTCKQLAVLFCVASGQTPLNWAKDPDSMKAIYVNKVNEVYRKNAARVKRAKQKLEIMG